MKPPKEIFVIIEGEGGRASDGEFRRSWTNFLAPIKDFALAQQIRKFQIVCGGSSNSSYEKFCRPKPDALYFLILDADGPVETLSDPWTALRRKCPPHSDASHCFLMVQCLENWLLSDLETLQKHYGSCFSSSSIPHRQDIEAIPYRDAQSALESATRKCKSPYRHAHANELIGKISLSAAQKLPSIRHMFATMPEVIAEYARQ